jgi:hypothetical protein
VADWNACAAARLKGLARRIENIEKAIAEHLARHRAPATAERLLRGVPCLGAVSTVTLLAHLPGLGHASRRAIASLGGLAPRARESGSTRAGAPSATAAGTSAARSSWRASVPSATPASSRTSPPG